MVDKGVKIAKKSTEQASQDQLRVRNQVDEADHKVVMS